MPQVRVIKECVVTVNGIPTPLRLNDSYDSNDQVVQEHKWAFAPDGVERATARPGEQRNR